MSSFLVAALLLASPRAEVLIYLANEPAPTAGEAENAHRIAGWLRESPERDDQLLGEGIEEDLRVFPTQVDVDVAAIERNLSRLAGVVVATNRLLKQGVVLVGRGERLGRVPLVVAPPRDGREASNPLSSAQNVRSVLERARVEFAEADFVIAVQSHGDERYALTPRLGLPTEGLTREALLARVHGSNDVFVERYGIATGDLVSLVGGVHPSLLVLASCRSTLEAFPAETPPTLVAANGDPLPYGAIDYERVFTSKASSLKHAFITELTASHFELATPETLERRRWVRASRLLPYFLPLAAWLGAVVWFRRRRARPSLVSFSG
ncbi:MAG: hypothetical protein ABTQ32_25660 [Myxococcaceae bacterium]